MAMAYADSKLQPVRDATALMRKREGPYLGELKPKRVVFASDLEGHLDVLESVVKRFEKNTDLFVFCGDYVDRGEKGVETLALLASLYLKDPGRYVILRGNHEDPTMNERYGFGEEVARKFGTSRLYDDYSKFFAVMPYAVVVNGYFCAHAGISEGLRTPDQVRRVRWPGLTNEGDMLAYGLVWNDPVEEPVRFVDNTHNRGPGTYSYGTLAVDEFLKNNGLRGIIRGHEVIKEGIRYQMGGKVITVCTTARAGVDVSILRMEDGELSKEKISH